MMTFFTILHTISFEVQHKQVELHTLFPAKTSRCIKSGTTLKIHVLCTFFDLILTLYILSKIYDVIFIILRADEEGMLLLGNSFQ